MKNVPIHQTPAVKPVEYDEYKCQEDIRTLTRAAEIKKDPQRMALIRVKIAALQAFLEPQGKANVQS